MRLAPGAPRPGLGRCLRRLRVIHIGWDVGFGRSGFNAEDARRLAQRARNGSVARMPGRGRTGTGQEVAALVAAVRQAIVLLRRRGFGFCRLDALLELPGYDEAA